MKIYSTPIVGVRILEASRFGDNRGYFSETYRQSQLQEAGIRCQFVQDNESMNDQGVVRGVHYQLDFPQAKLCRVPVGKVLDVVVDIRRGSPTFGKTFHIVLSGVNRRQIFIPRGCAHGFQSLEENTLFLYKCDEYYDAQDKRGIHYRDPLFDGIWWKLEPETSLNDGKLPYFQDIPEKDLPVFEPTSVPDVTVPLMTP